MRFTKRQNKSIFCHIVFSLISIIFTNLKMMALEIPDFGSIINYAESQIPTSDTIIKFIIQGTTTNHSINISEIPGFSLFQPYVPKEAYDFIGKLKLTDIKATKDPKASNEIISAQADIPIASGKSLPTNIRIILGSHQASNNKPASKHVAKAPQKQTYWQQFEGYFNIENYVNYATSYIDAIKDSIAREFSKLEFGLVIELPQGFKFAQLNPALSFLDLAKFKQAALALGTSFNDPVYNSIEPGLTTVLKLELQEPFTKINEFVKNVSQGAHGLKQKEFELRGHILPSITGTALKTPKDKQSDWGTFLFNLANKKILEAHDLGIKLISLPPEKGKKKSSGYSLGIAGGLKLYLNNINNKLTPLDFTGFFAVDTALQAKLNANMAGLLDLTALGLPFKFGDVSINENLDIKNMKNFNLDALKLSGTFNFGSSGKKANLASTFDINFHDKDINILAYGDLTAAGKNKKNALSLTDILNLTTTAYKKLDKEADKFKSSIPEFGIKNAQFYFTPIPLLYNNRTLNSGITLDAALDIFGGSAQAEFILDQTGFDAVGYTTSDIDLGQVKIVGASKNPAQCLSLDTCSIGCKGNPTVKTEKIILPTKVKTDLSKAFKLADNLVPDSLKKRPDFSKLKGGVINIFFHPPKDIGMLINARIKATNLSIGDIDSDACINVSTNGLYASFEQKIWGLLNTQFTAYAKDYKNPNKWYICGKMPPTTENILGKAITDIINKAKNKATAKLEDAENQVKAAKKVYDKALSAAQEKAKKAENDMKKKLEKAKRDCGS